jgi:hypothetical protein
MIRLLAIALAFLAALPAFAQSCDAANKFTFLNSNQAAATLAYGSTYNYTAANGGDNARIHGANNAERADQHNRRRSADAGHFDAGDRLGFDQARLGDRRHLRRPDHQHYRDDPRHHRDLHLQHADP